MFRIEENDVKVYVLRHEGAEFSLVLTAMANTL